MERGRRTETRQNVIVASEHDEQVTLVERMASCGLFYTSICNGGYRRPGEAAKLVAEGIQAGFPDLIILTPPPLRPDVRLVAVEMKRVRGGRVSPEQRVWHERLEQMDIPVIIGLGWYNAAYQLTVEYGYPLLQSGQVERFDSFGYPKS